MQDARRYHGFSVGREGEVAIVTLDVPGKMNALDLVTKRELTEVLFQLNLDGRTRAILVTGANGNFCAGDGLSGIQEDGEHEHLGVTVPNYSRQPIHTYRVVRSVTHALIRGVLESDVPLVAAIDGYAIQSGLTLALACDLRVASPGAKLASGTLRFAMLPDEGGHHLLIQTIGLAAAMKFVLLSEFAGGKEACRLGLVHEVTTQDSAFERGLDMARQLADGPATALRLSKRALRRAAESTFEQSLDGIALSAAISDYDPDMELGRQRFREKTNPTWRRFAAESEGGQQH